MAEPAYRLPGVEQARQAPQKLNMMVKGHWLYLESRLGPWPLDWVLKISRDISPSPNLWRLYVPPSDEETMAARYSAFETCVRILCGDEFAENHNSPGKDIPMYEHLKRFLLSWYFSYLKRENLPNP
jgi:hypothetical protein